MDQQDSRTATVGQKRARGVEIIHLDSDSQVASPVESYDPSLKRRKFDDAANYFVEDNSEEGVELSDAISPIENAQNNLNHTQKLKGKARPSGYEDEIEKAKAHAVAICSKPAIPMVRSQRVILLTAQKPDKQPKAMQIRRALLAIVAKDLYPGLVAMSIIDKLKGKWESEEYPHTHAVPQYLLGYDSTEAANTALNLAHRKIMYTPPTGKKVSLVAIKAQPSGQAPFVNTHETNQADYDVFIKARITHVQALLHPTIPTEVGVGAQPSSSLDYLPLNASHGALEHNMSPMVPQMITGKKINSVAQRKNVTGQSQNPTVNRLHIESSSRGASGKIGDLDDPMWSMVPQMFAGEKMHSVAQRNNVTRQSQNATANGLLIEPSSRGTFGGIGDSNDPDSSAQTPIRMKHLSLDARALQTRYWGLTDDDAMVRCPVCSRYGHYTDTCRSRTCKHCGVEDGHFASACPTFKKCSRCRERGHNVSECPSKLARSTADGLICDLCEGPHAEDKCSWIWRTFHPEDLSAIWKVDQMITACYECGAHSHFGDDCGRKPRDKIPNSDVFSAKFANQFLHRPITSSSENGMRILGKARLQNAHENEQSGETENFLAVLDENHRNAQVAEGLDETANFLAVLDEQFQNAHDKEEKFAAKPTKPRKQKIKVKPTNVQPTVNPKGYHAVPPPTMGNLGNYQVVPPPQRNGGSFNSRGFGMDGAADEPNDKPAKRGRPGPRGGKARNVSSFTSRGSKMNAAADKPDDKPAKRGRPGPRGQKTKRARAASGK